MNILLDRKYSQRHTNPPACPAANSTLTVTVTFLWPVQFAGSLLTGVERGVA
jgi:hypothetical protein